MKEAEKLIELIESDFAGSGLKEACLIIFNFLANSQINDLQHITFSNLNKIVGFNLPNEDLLKVSSYFSGNRVHLLEEHFEFIDDKEDSFEVEKSDLSIALKEGFLLHPNFQTPVEDFKSKVFIYFVPSMLLKSLNKSY